MISLSRHIELLLLEHDCIIAPGLGGFIANHVPARYNEERDNLFLPPYRSVCFNRNLQTNDGLLVQAYMTAYDASYPAAYKQMSNDIEEVLDTLDIEGSFELPGVGTLNKDINDNITFTSIDAGILTPTLYGLYSISIKSKEEAEREKQIQQALHATNVLPIQTEHDKQDATDIRTIIAAKDNKEKTQGKHTKFIDIAVACVASVLLFFVFSYPTNHNKTSSDAYIASTVNIQSEIKEKPSPITVGIQDAVQQENIENTVDEIKEVKTVPETTTVLEITQETEKTTYTIVLASCVIKDNAEDLIRRLNKAGFPYAEFVRGEKMNRVVYSSYSTFDEATEELQLLRLENPLFKEAWVYKNKR